MTPTSWVVYGITLGGKKKILRRFPGDEAEAAAHFVEHCPMYRLDDVFMEPSRLSADLGDFAPVRPFRVDDTQPDVHVVYDAGGHEVATVRGPRNYRKAVAFMICSGVTSRYIRGEAA